MCCSVISLHVQLLSLWWSECLVVTSGVVKDLRFEDKDLGLEDKDLWSKDKDLKSKDKVL